MYTSLVSDLLFPLHERLKGHDSLALRRRMEQTQWWAPEQIAALQTERLRALLTQAAEVPYWRDLFGELKFDPRAVTRVTDLQALPLLDKATIRAHTEAMKHPRARGLKRFNTGGSSGEPLIFFIGNERVSHDVAAKWRATRWWDVDIGDREIVVWGSPIELGSQDRIRAVRDKLLRTELLPAFEMSEAKLDHFVATIRARRPRMLFGYPSALSHIARHAESRGQRQTQPLAGGPRILHAGQVRQRDAHRRIAETQGIDDQLPVRHAAGTDLARRGAAGQFGLGKGVLEGLEQSGRGHPPHRAEDQHQLRRDRGQRCQIGGQRHPANSNLTNFHDVSL